MEQALYRQWRPKNWEEVVGQEHVVRTLRNAVRAERVGHAFLFAGPRGTGKTTLARVLAKAVNCQAPSTADRPCNACENCLAVNEGRFLDLIEIDAASNTSVEDVRDLRDRINFAPNRGRFKVYIVDEVHMLSTAAFNALLKTLEEPPPHAIFILATTEVHKIPATVLSRCQRHEFRRLPVAAIEGYLQRQVAAQGMSVEPGVLGLISRQATGSLRDAISLLDQLVSTGDTVTLDFARVVMGTASNEYVVGIVRSIVEHEIGLGLERINQALDSGADPRQLARQVVEYLRGLLLVRTGNQDLVDVPEEVGREMQSLSAGLALADLLNALRAFSRAAADSRGSWQPGLPLELALIEAARPRPAALPESPATPEASNSSAKPKPPARSSDTDAAPPSSAASSHSTEAGTPVSPSAPQAALLERWREVLKAAYRRDPRAQALLNSCKPLGIEKGNVVLAFSSDLLREKMEKGHNLACVQEALQEVMGEPFGVRCVLAREPVVKQAAREPEGPRSTAAVEEGGMVATAIRDLGAQVMDVKQLPPEGNA
ncbi:MAG: DNA polymerase III subunit gamma/tau [Anaerolineales bacterium]|nr:DNA polymerase III subunit gamma/tau [Anaerolineales bacterium]